MQAKDIDVFIEKAAQKDKDEANINNEDAVESGFNKCIFLLL